MALFRKRKKAGPEPLVTRGREAFSVGNYEEALECFSDALDLDPSAADVHYYRAMCFHNAKRWDEAVRDLRRGVELGLDPPTMAEHYLAKSLFHAGQYEESISLFSALLANNPDGFGQVTPHEWFELRGMARCKHRDFNAAKKDLEEARAALPAGLEVAEQGPIAYWLLVCKHAGDEDRAREEWLGQSMDCSQCRPEVLDTEQFFDALEANGFTVDRLTGGAGTVVSGVYSNVGSVDKSLLDIELDRQTLF